MRSPRIEWISLLRVSLVLAVVVLHATGYSRDHQIPGWASTSVSLLDPYRMPVLILLAGLFAPRVGSRASREFVLRRVSSLGWPYLVWTTLMYLAYRGGEHRIHHGLVTELATTTQVTWFLLYLLGFSLAILLLPSTKARAVALVATLLLNSAITATVGTDPHRVGLLLACYLAGSLIDPVRLSTGPTWQRASIVAAASLGAIAVSLLSELGEVRWLTPLWLLGVLSLLLATRPLFSAVATTRLGRKASRVGDCTVVVLLVHIPVLGIVAEVISPLHLSWVAGFGLVCSGGVIASMVAVAVVRRWPVLWTLFDLRRGVREVRALRAAWTTRGVIEVLPVRSVHVLPPASGAESVA